MWTHVLWAMAKRVGFAVGCQLKHVETLKKHDKAFQCHIISELSCYLRTFCCGAMSYFRCKSRLTGDNCEMSAWDEWGPCSARILATNLNILQTSQTLRSRTCNTAIGGLRRLGHSSVQYRTESMARQTARAGGIPCGRHRVFDDF